MAVQRNIFRIEEVMQAGHEPDTTALGEAAFSSDIVAELRALRALMEQHLPAAAETRAAADTPSQDMRRLRIELDVIGDAIRQTRSEIVSLQDQGFDSSRVARVTKELEAVVDDTSGATDRILKAAEEIDLHAQALMSFRAGDQKGGTEQGIAQDIQDCVTAIFEACNFHDLTGQRLAKVGSTLKMVEEHLARMMEIWSVIERFNVAAAQSAASHLDEPLNGPKLDGDNGHSSQDEIDKLFR